MMLRQRNRQGGFSLVEVSLAIGLLGAVLVAISSLFVIGGKRVRQGRERTEALSVATHVMETLNQMSYRGLYTNFSVASNPGAATGPIVIDSRTTTFGAATGWQPLLDEKLEEGYALVTLTRISGADFRTSEGIRVRTTVFWDDLNRTRNLTLETIRF